MTHAPTPKTLCNTLCALLACTALTNWPGGVLAQDTTPAPAVRPTGLPPLNQPLGMFCDRSPLTPDGKIILNAGDHVRVKCEAYRAAALNYAHLLETTRNRVVQALNVLPPPLRQDLMDHLKTSPDIGAWRPKSEDLIRLEAAARRDTTDELDWLNDIRGYWGDGVLGGTGVAAAWHTAIRVRARNNHVVIWLDPEWIRDIWSPEMVQRTVEAWYRTRPNVIATERAPKIITGGRDAPVIRRIDGKEKRLAPEFDTMNGGTQDLPRGVLAMDALVSTRIDHNSERFPCLDPDKVGYIRKIRASLHGIYLKADETTPMFDGSGALVAGDDAWREQRNTCVEDILS